jgi:uncharacterized RDD family membrane protein YckC
MSQIKRKYRTFVQRLASALLDGIIFLPVSLLFENLTDTGNKAEFILWLLLYDGIWLSYSVYMHGRYGQTLGKMASNVKLYSLDEISVIGYKRAFLREIIWAGISLIGMLYLVFTATGNPKSSYEEFTSYPILISVLLELITMFFNKKRRAIHDLIAGSVVLDITKYKKWDIEYEEPQEPATQL